MDSGQFEFPVTSRSLIPQLCNMVLYCQRVDMMHILVQMPRLLIVLQAVRFASWQEMHCAVILQSKCLCLFEFA